MTYRLLPLLSASHGLTEEQTAIYELATDFAAKEMLPNMALWDEKVWIICFFCAVDVHFVSSVLCVCLHSYKILVRLCILTN